MWLIYKLIYKLNTRRTGSTKGYSEYKEETQTANQAEQAVQHNRKWRETEAMNTQRENGVKGSRNIWGTRITDHLNPNNEAERKVKQHKRRNYHNWNSEINSKCE